MQIETWAGEAKIRNLIGAFKHLLGSGMSMQQRIVPLLQSVQPVHTGTVPCPYPEALGMSYTLPASLALQLRSPLANPRQVSEDLRAPSPIDLLLPLQEMGYYETWSRGGREVVERSRVVCSRTRSLDGGNSGSIQNTCGRCAFCNITVNLYANSSSGSNAA